MFKNFEDRETSDTHSLLLRFLDQINFKGSDKYVLLSNISINYT